MDIPFRDPAALAAFARPLIEGERRPESPAELMASRYVAYSTGEIDYLLDTHAPETRHQVDRKATETWSKSSEWVGLEILRTEKGGPDDQTGQVEFIARYRRDGADHVHHELSDFRRIDGRWFFVDGKIVAEPPMHRASPKIGRNDPCPCGSGKKYKKCCG
ncbi:MAG TPA: YchJ family protein [Polyangiales bacterium]|nr:YchJ family protein [Polyangiales bacterium]